MPQMSVQRGWSWRIRRKAKAEIQAEDTNAVEREETNEATDWLRPPWYFWFK